MFITRSITALAAVFVLGLATTVYAEEFSESSLANSDEIIGDAEFHDTDGGRIHVATPPAGRGAAMLDRINRGVLEPAPSDSERDNAADLPVITGERGTYGSYVSEVDPYTHDLGVRLPNAGDGEYDEAWDNSVLSPTPAHID